MPPDSTLALDLSATVVGWACAPITSKLPQSGVWQLPKVGGRGARYACFVNVFNDALEQWGPRNIYLEGALPPQAQTHAESAKQIYGILALVEEAAWRASVPVSSSHVDLIRSDVLGRCRWYGPKGAPKRAVIQFVRELGLDITDHNEADAVIAWIHYQQSMRGIPSARLPLLRAGGISL